MSVQLRKTVSVQTTLLSEVTLAIPWHPDLSEPRIAWVGGRALAEQVSLGREYQWKAEPVSGPPEIGRRDSDGRAYEKVPEFAIRQTMAALLSSADCPATMPTLIRSESGSLTIPNPLETICLLHAGVTAVPVAFCQDGPITIPGLLSSPEPAQNWRHTIREGDAFPPGMTMAYPVAELLEYVSRRVWKYNLARIDLDMTQTMLFRHRSPGPQEKEPPVSLGRQLHKAIREYDHHKSAPACQNALDLLGAAGVMHVRVQDVYNLETMLADLEMPVRASERQRLNPTGEPLDLIGRHERIAQSLARRQRDRDPDSAMRDRLAEVLRAVGGAILQDGEAGATARRWNVAIGLSGLLPGGSRTTGFNPKAPS